MGDILSGFVGQSPTQQALAKRMKDKGLQVRAMVAGLASQIIQARNQIRDAIFNDTKMPPALAVTAIDAVDDQAKDHAGESYSLFKLDEGLAGILVTALKNAGAKEDVIEASVPGVPDTYDVKLDDSAKTVSISVKTA